MLTLPRSFRSNFRDKVESKHTHAGFFFSLFFFISQSASKSVEESSSLAVIYISSRWLNVHHPSGVSARRHDGCPPALFRPVIECYGPEEVSVAFQHMQPLIVSLHHFGPIRRQLLNSSVSCRPGGRGRGWVGFRFFSRR